MDLQGSNLLPFSFHTSWSPPLLLTSSGTGCWFLCGRYHDRGQRSPWPYTPGLCSSASDHLSVNKHTHIHIVVDSISQQRPHMGQWQIRVGKMSNSRFKKCFKSSIGVVIMYLLYILCILHSCWFYIISNDICIIFKVSLNVPENVKYFQYFFTFF